MNDFIKTKEAIHKCKDLNSVYLRMVKGIRCRNGHIWDIEHDNKCPNCVAVNGYKLKEEK